MTHQNIKKLIEKLGFVPTNLTQTAYLKKYSQHNDYELSLDFEKEKIDFGSLIEIGDGTTSHFESPENFVVLECVNRLLEKGYEPQDITLEKRWSLGRTSKSGKADITVRGRNQKTLLIIECKTFGNEYEKELKRTIDNGGQIFSYLQQDKNAQLICIYASVIDENDALIYKNAIIPIKDRETDLKEFENGSLEVKLYQQAKTKEELHAVWIQNLEGYFAANGLFENDIKPYEPGAKPLRKKNLLPFNKDTGKGVFAKFQEILRHNNISDKSNAFNRFISLMLAKIVDETKLEDEELDFQFIEGVDTYEDFQDRLQKLYVKGMGKYLKETIVYHSNDEIEDIIKHFPRTSAKRRIKRLFREQKFYSNNDFAFIEVHNKVLFEQNVKVLKEVVQLLQSYRFKYANKEPFLGNFFELMLNDGYKQSEGQFFTPLPIAKFMISSIPIKEIILDKIKKEEDNVLPYTIDYACGSGHFLTETIDEIQQIVQELVIEKPELKEQLIDFQDNTKWAGEFIYGIEKDYRLSRTSQVACFLNGDGDANIIFGDGLEDYPRLRHRNNEKIQFDVLIANPPYAVRDFKPHLRLENNTFSLLEELSDNANEIEVLFIERMTQLLRIGGKAAIVLPNSVLQSGGVYQKTRALLLRDFYIKGIVELGKNSFMATSIKPIILFLEKRNPSYAEDAALIADDLILQNKKRKYELIDSEDLLKKYCAYINVDMEEYASFLAKKASNTFNESDFYKNYDAWFKEHNELKKLEQKASFKQATNESKIESTSRLFYELVLAIEKEKFEFFILTHQQTTVVVKTGATTDSEKAFLGYSFSNRTGSEGMKEERDENGKLSTKLYDEESNINYSKINSYIYNYFLNNKNLPEIDTSLSEYLSYHNLSDLLTFDEVSFNNCVDTSFKSQINYETIWNIAKQKLVTLEQLAEGKKGKSITKSQVGKGEIPVIAGGKVSAYKHSISNHEGNIITVSASGANAGYLWYHTTPIFASDCSVIFSRNEQILPTRLLFHLLQYIQPYLYQLQRGQAQPHVYWRDLSKVLLPNINDKNWATKLLASIDDLEANKEKYLKGNIKVADIEQQLELQRRKIIEKAITLL